MTAFLIVLFVLSSVAIFFSYRNSQDRQINASVTERLDSYNQNVADSYEFMNRVLRSLTLALYPDVGQAATTSAFLVNQATPVQTFLNGRLKQTVDAGMFGAEAGMALYIPSSTSDQALVVASSDENLIYKWQPPDYLLQAIRDGKSYLYLPNGMPELGLSDETLVLLKTGDPGANFPLTFVRVSSVHDEVASVNAFYDKQRKDAALVLGLILLISLVLLIFLSYLGLAYLIRRRITKPIDELAAVADEVSEGNLEVEIKIKKGEEFEGLKYTFKQLLDSFNAVISGSVGEKEAAPRPKRGRSRFLFEATAYLVILFILSGLAIFFSFTNVRNRQFNTSVDNLITDYANVVSEAFDNVTPQLLELSTMTLPPFDPQEPILAILEKRINEYVHFIDVWMQKIIDEGALSANRMFLIAMPSAFIQQAEIVMSSDESLIYNWPVPDYLQQVINDNKIYVYLPRGIPELGMNDESLVIIKKMEGMVNLSFPSAFVGVGSIHEKVAAINDFYNNQKKDSTILMVLIMLISALLLSLLSFFALRYLIRKRITKPVDELSAAAEEVMEGNLDVEIEIHKGEEFEGLKYAFKELLDAFRSVISQSVEDN